MRLEELEEIQREILEGMVVCSTSDSVLERIAFSKIN